MSEEQRQRLLLSLEVDRAGCRARQLRALRDLEKAELVDDPSCSDVAEAWSREVERLDALTDLLSEAVGRHE